MADLKPPRDLVGERDVLCGLLQYQRESLVRKVTGVDDVMAQRSPVASGTSLGWLVWHLAHAERLWVLDRFAGIDVELPSTDGSVTEGCDAYRATWARVDPVLREGDLDAPCARMGDAGPPPTLRWVLAHLLEETARHAGHADILRELHDGSTGR